MLYCCLTLDSSVSVNVVDGTLCKMIDSNCESLATFNVIEEGAASFYDDPRLSQLLCDHRFLVTENQDSSLTLYKHPKLCDIVARSVIVFDFGNYFVSVDSTTTWTVIKM